MIDEKLIKILVYSVRKSDIRLEEEKIVCIKCNRHYTIRNGAPVMLIDEAEGGNT